MTRNWFYGFAVGLIIFLGIFFNPTRVHEAVFDNKILVTKDLLKNRELLTGFRTYMEEGQINYLLIESESKGALVYSDFLVPFFKDREFSELENDFVKEFIYLIRTLNPKWCKILVINSSKVNEVLINKLESEMKKQNALENDLTSLISLKKKNIFVEADLADYDVFIFFDMVVFSLYKDKLKGKPVILASLDQKKKCLDDVLIIMGFDYKKLGYSFARRNFSKFSENFVDDNFCFEIIINSNEADSLGLELNDEVKTRFKII